MVCRLKDQGFILYAKSILRSFDFIDEEVSSGLPNVLILANHQLWGWTNNMFLVDIL